MRSSTPYVDDPNKRVKCSERQEESCQSTRRGKKKTQLCPPPPFTEYETKNGLVNIQEISLFFVISKIQRESCDI